MWKQCLFGLFFLPLAMACAGDTEPGDPVEGFGLPPKSAGFVPPEGGLPPKKWDGQAGAGPTSDLCTSGPNKKLVPIANIYYGTKTPTYLPLTQGQIAAVGTFWGCSGLLVNPTWVLTASHCNLNSGREFCIGFDAKNPNVCIGAKKVVNHPSADLTLFQLKQDARTRLPGVVPIPLLTEKLGSSWIGKTAEAAGYGQQETGKSGEREFTAEPIVKLDSQNITIYGEGKHGACFGDSGGPVMVIASDGSVRAAGALSNGDSSCLGYDRYTRVDLLLGWIEGHTGPTIPPGPVACGDVTHAGFCHEGSPGATYCGQDGTLKVTECKASERCSWSASADGWRCVAEADDACHGLTAWGFCSGNTLKWCGEGGLLERDCGACGETCVPHDTYGYRCVPSECGDLTFLGRCKGDVAEWCNRNGAVETRNCAKYGQGCGWLSDESGYYCIEGQAPQGSCGDLDYTGRCKGNVAEWCKDGVVETRDCASWGQVCGWAGSDKGYYCIAASGCGDLDYHGRCEGSTAAWCEAGKIQKRDCAAQGQACGWAGDAKGYYCVDSKCAGLDYLGRCSGKVAEWCKEGSYKSRDCATSGMVCGWLGDEKGYYCQ